MDHFKSFDYLPEIVIIIDIDETIIYCNDRVAKLSYKKEDLIHKKLTKIIPNMYQNIHKTYIHKYLETGHSSIMNKGREVTVKCGDNEIRNCYLNISKIEIDGNIYFCGQLFCIFDSEIIDNALDTYRIVKSNLSIAVVKMHLDDSKILYITDSISNILGYLPEEMIGKFSLNFIHKDDFNTFLEKMNNVRKDKLMNDKTMYRKKHKNGNYIWLENHTIGIDNNIILFTERDITVEMEHKEMLRKTESELLEEHRLKELEIEKNKSKREFMQYVFHESRGWMNTITLGLQTCKQIMKNNEEVSDLLEDLQSANDNITKIFNDTLTLQKIDAGELTYEYEPFSMNKLISLACEGVKYLSEPKEIIIKIQIDEIYNNYYVNGDILRLSQCLRNYLSNAIKFSKHNSCVHINVYFESRDVDVITTKISVVDNGCGIHQINWHKIFRQFQQIRSGELQNGGGSGLGLSLVKQFVEIGHNGKVGFVSEYGVGSEFFMVIPFEISSEKTNVSSTSSPKHCWEHLDLDVFYDKTVLVVEDVDICRKMICKFLESNSITFDKVENGLQALDKIKNKCRYKIILMDKEMPLMDGHEATLNIRKLGYTLPIVGLTGNAFEEQQDEFRKHGADYILLKPLDLKKFTELRLIFNF